MRLIKLIVENYRCYVTPTEIKFCDLTALVGKNDIGKSTIMDALAVFFEEAKLDKDDLSKTSSSNTIKITCEFDQLPDQIFVDTDFPTSLKKEYLLSKNNTLIIRKSYSGNLSTPRIVATEAYGNHPTADKFCDLLTLKKNELSDRATELGVDLTEVNKNKNAPVREAIWDTANDLNLRMTYIPLDKEGTKQVWSSIQHFLPTFALFKSDKPSTDQDPEAQNPLKAAINDAIKEVEEKLLDVKVHVENEVMKIGEATVKKLREMNPEFAEELNPVITTKKWESLFQTSITSAEGIPLNKRGSGFRRLVLLNFFRAKAEKVAVSKSSSSVIYAVEEPETSQHPDNQRLLLRALNEIANDHDMQVIMTTHTSMLVRYLPIESIRFIQMNDTGARLISVGETTIIDIAKSLGVLPDHNVKAFIGLEGINDINFLQGISKILKESGENVPDLGSLDLEGKLIFIPLGGSNLSYSVSLFGGLNIPEYYIFDSDKQNSKQIPHYKDQMDKINSKNDCKAVSTKKRALENYIDPDAVKEAYAEVNIEVSFKPFGDFEDVPKIVAEAVSKATSDTQWECLSEEKKKSKISKAKKFLNKSAVQKMTPERLIQSDPNKEIQEWLMDISSLLKADEN